MKHLCKCVASNVGDRIMGCISLAAWQWKSRKKNTHSVRTKAVHADELSASTVTLWLQKKKYAKRRTIMRTHKTIGTKHTETTLILD